METIPKIEKLMGAAGVFHCGSCTKTLAPPIWLVNGDNFCDTCHTSLKAIDKQVTSLKNDAMATIMEHMLLPCPFKSQGCAQLLFRDELEVHETVCCYLFNEPCFIDSCNWKGQRSDLASHFRDEHEESVTASSDGRIFTLEWYHAKMDLYILLETFNGSFFAQIKADVGTFEIILYDAESYSPRQTGDFNLRYTAKDNNILVVPCGIIDYSNTAAFRESDERYRAKIELGDLVASEIDRSYVDLVYHLEDYLPLTKSLRQKFTCFVCKELTRDLLVCPQNHFVCEYCHAQKSHVDCGKLSPNSVLTTVSEIYFFPCPYEKFGCRFRVQAFSGHELRCRYRVIKCPVEQCTHTAMIEELILHIGSQHSGLSIYDDYCIFGDNKKSFERYFLVFNKLFHFRFKREAVTDKNGAEKYVYNWKAVGLGMVDQYNSFTFVIGSIAAESDKTFIRCEPCDSENNSSDGFTLTEDQKQKYFPNPFRFYIKITSSGNYDDAKPPGDILLRLK